MDPPHRSTSFHQERWGSFVRQAQELVFLSQVYHRRGVGARGGRRPRTPLTRLLKITRRNARRNVHRENMEGLMGIREAGVGRGLRRAAAPQEASDDVRCGRGGAAPDERRERTWTRLHAKPPPRPLPAPPRWTGVDQVWGFSGQEPPEPPTSHRRATDEPPAGFPLLKGCWRSVERPFAWSGGSRRMSQDDAARPETSAALVETAGAA